MILLQVPGKLSLALLLGFAHSTHEDQIEDFVFIDDLHKNSSLNIVDAPCQESATTVYDVHPIHPQRS
jgi:hypothetical protein